MRSRLRFLAVRRALGLTVVLLGALGAAPLAAQAPRAAAPLASFASQRVIVTPIQLLRGDSLSWVTPATWSTFRKQLDDAIGSAIAERGIGTGWSYASDVARIAKRNQLYTSDPYSLGAQPWRGVLYKPQDRIPGVMASNLRALIALGDTRYALMPVELVFERRDDRQRATLRFALLDGRGGAIVWVGDVTSDPATALTPQWFTDLAAKVADLVAAR